MDWCKRGGNRDYVTTRDVEWTIGGKYSDEKIVIKTGFEFESSVPTITWKNKLFQKWLGWFQPFHWVFSPHDPRFLLSALVHDWLLEVKKYEVLAAAAEWHAAAKKSNAPKLRRRLGFIAVSLYTLESKEYTHA